MGTTRSPRPSKILPVCSTSIVAVDPSRKLMINNDTRRPQRSHQAAISSEPITSPGPSSRTRPRQPVEVREWIRPAPASPDLVLEAQPPAQPHSGVAVDRPIRLVDGAYLEVVRPSAQRTVQLLHQLCGISQCLRSGSERVNGFHHALDAFLRWPVTQARLAGSR